MASESYMAMVNAYPANSLQSHELDDVGLSDIPYGSKMREEFGLEPGSVFLNHGSYGTVPTRVLQLQHKYNEERERHPDLWYRHSAKMYMDKARQDVAVFINAKVENVMIVANVTTALNILVKNYPFKKGDAILVTTIAYGSVQILAEDFTSRVRPDVEKVHLDLKFPIQSEDDVLSRFEVMLDNHPNIRVALIDHITSPSAILMPLVRLTKLCRSRGVKVFVDGAHAIGQVPLDMKDLMPDAYTSNMHKWAYSPRGAALLWFAEEHRGWINPPNSSWQITEGLDLQFYDQGAVDHVPFICAHHGLQFYKAIGGMEKVVDYTSKLSDKARDTLCETLGLEHFNIPRSMEAPNMKLFKLPTFPKFPAEGINTWNLHKELMVDNHIYGYVCSINGEFYIRLSVQVYNDMDDFNRLAKVLKFFIEKHAQE